MKRRGSASRRLYPKHVGHVSAAHATPSFSHKRGNSSPATVAYCAVPQGLYLLMGGWIDVVCPPLFYACFPLPQQTANLGHDTGAGAGTGTGHLYPAATARVPPAGRDEPTVVATMLPRRTCRAVSLEAHEHSLRATRSFYERKGLCDFPSRVRVYRYLMFAHVLYGLVRPI